MAMKNTNMQIYLQQASSIKRFLDVVFCDMDLEFNVNTIFKQNDCKGYVINMMDYQNNFQVQYFIKKDISNEYRKILKYICTKLSTSDQYLMIHDDLPECSHEVFNNRKAKIISASKEFIAHENHVKQLDQSDSIQQKCVQTKKALNDFARDSFCTVKVSHPAFSDSDCVEIRFTTNDFLKTNHKMVVNHVLDKKMSEVLFDAADNYQHQINRLEEFDQKDQRRYCKMVKAAQTNNTNFNTMSLLQKMKLLQKNMRTLASQWQRDEMEFCYE